MACAGALSVTSLAVAPAKAVASSSVSAFRAGVYQASFAPLSARRSLRGEDLRFGARRAGSAKFDPFPIRAAASDETTPDLSKQAEEVINDLKTKWDGIENKTTVAIYGSGALVAIWFSSTVVSTINTVPLLPKLMELIGLGYTGWFVYRYLLFKDNRQELAAELKELQSKITGSADDIAS